MTTVKETQTYYAECLLPDEEQGLRIAVTLTKTADDQTLPDKIRGNPCVGTECPHGGRHDLYPISAFAAEKLMADEEDEARKTNVFEWCWEHAQVEGDDRRVLLYLAFHATGRWSDLPDPEEFENDLKLSWSAADCALARLDDSGHLVVNRSWFAYTFPGYEKWLAQR